MDAEQIILLYKMFLRHPSVLIATAPLIEIMTSIQSTEWTVPIISVARWLITLLSNRLKEKTGKRNTDEKMIQSMNSTGFNCYILCIKDNTTISIEVLLSLVNTIIANEGPKQRDLMIWIMSALMKELTKINDSTLNDSNKEARRKSTSEETVRKSSGTSGHSKSPEEKKKDDKDNKTKDAKSSNLRDSNEKKKDQEKTSDKNLKTKEVKSSETKDIHEKKKEQGKKTGNSKIGNTTKKLVYVHPTKEGVDKIFNGSRHNKDIVSSSINDGITKSPYFDKPLDNVDKTSKLSLSKSKNATSGNKLNQPTSSSDLPSTSTDQASTSGTDASNHALSVDKTKKTADCILNDSPPKEIPTKAKTVIERFMEKDTKPSEAMETNIVQTRSKKSLGTKDIEPCCRMSNKFNTKPTSKDYYLSINKVANDAGLGRALSPDMTTICQAHVPKGLYERKQPFNKTKNSSKVISTTKNCEPNSQDLEELEMAESLVDMPDVESTSINTTPKKKDNYKEPITSPVTVSLKRLPTNLPERVLISPLGNILTTNPLEGVNPMFSTPEENTALADIQVNILQQNQPSTSTADDCYAPILPSKWNPSKQPELAALLAAKKLAATQKLAAFRAKANQKQKIKPAILQLSNSPPLTLLVQPSTLPIIPLNEAPPPLLPSLSSIIENEILNNPPEVPQFLPLPSLPLPTLPSLPLIDCDVSSGSAILAPTSLPSLPIIPCNETEIPQSSPPQSPDTISKPKNTNVEQIIPQSPDIFEDSQLEDEFEQGEYRSPSQNSTFFKIPDVTSPPPGYAPIFALPSSNYMVEHNNDNAREHSRRSSEQSHSRHPSRYAEQRQDYSTTSHRYYDRTVRQKRSYNHQSSTDRSPYSSRYRNDRNSKRHKSSSSKERSYSPRSSNNYRKRKSNKNDRHRRESSGEESSHSPCNSKLPKQLQYTPTNIADLNKSKTNKGYEQTNVNLSESSTSQDTPTFSETDVPISSSPEKDYNNDTSQNDELPIDYVSPIPPPTPDGELESINSLSQADESQNIQSGCGTPSFTIEHLGKKFINKFNIEARETILKLLKPRKGKNVLDHYEKIINDLVDLFKSKTNPNQKIGVVIRNSNQMHYPLALSFRYVDQLDSQTLWNLIFRAAQSNAEFLLEGILHATVHLIQVPRGGARDRSRVYLNAEEFIASNRGLIKIKNDDQQCLAHAIVVGLAIINKVPRVKHLQDDKDRMDEKVAELLELANIDLRNGGSNEELNIIQDVLPAHIQIVVFDDFRTKHVHFVRDMPDATDHIYLFLNNNHYDVISSICNFCLSSYFCTACFRPYEARIAHRCARKCPCCRLFPICKKASIFINCNICGRKFHSQQCHDNHLTHFLNKTKTVCDFYKKCNICDRTYTMYKNRKEPHTCNEVFCTNCRMHFPKGHQCYIKKDSKQEPPSDSSVLFIYFDAESTLDSPVSELESDGTLHNCNLIISHNQCSTCLPEQDITKLCSRCGTRRQVFDGSDPVGDFIKYLCLPRKQMKFKKIICTSHNMGGYDGVILLRYFIEVMKVTPTVIMRGSKIISMEYKGICFRDSLNFLPLKLSKLPATLGLPETLNKGTYPYLFNTLENSKYVGPMPDISFYDSESMSVKDRESFLQWHAQQIENNVVFNQKEQLIQYCDMDVEILRRSCTKFREIIIEIGNVDPLLETITLPHCASLIFRRNHLKEEQIGILHHRGYRWIDTQSLIAIKWLLSIERSENITIQHAANAREYKLPTGQLVDGYREFNGQKYVYEFNGCYHHSCSKCFPASENALQTDPHDTMQLRREGTERKLIKLRELGYNVIVMRECDFHNILKEDPELKSYVDNHPLVCEEPLTPKDAMYGGRTEAIRTYAEAEIGQTKMDFNDFRSLYPYAMKYSMVPLGHPEILLGPEFPDLATVEGLIKCVILPPSDLFLPLLPIHMNEKLLFILCRSCGENYIQTRCPHKKIEDRCLSGTWVLSEVKKAVSLGYKIIKIVEIWNYKISLYDKINNVDGVFTSFINTMLKIKQEASGFPSWCTSDELKAQYLRDFLEQEGILLDIERILLNPGLRAIAKLLLNSLYGRFAMNVERTQTAIINEPRKLYELLCNANNIVEGITCVGQETIVVNYKTPLELLPQNNTVNIVVAAFITCGARLHLYSYLERIPRSVCYMDTDSILTCQGNNQGGLPLGDNLGDLESEIEHGCEIDSYVSGGAKMYGIKINNADGSYKRTILKCRGISQNYSNSHLVNFDKLKRMMLELEDPVYIHNPRKIVRTKDFQIISKPQSKIFRTVHNKRRLVENSFITLPYGYNSEHDSEDDE